MTESPRATTEAVDLSGHRALVTGAASGIGAACARRLAHAGAAVVAVDVDERGLAALAEELGAAAPRQSPVETAVVDLVDPQSRIEEFAAGCDVVVNNAGLQHVAAIEDFPMDRFRYLVTLMLEAPFRIVRAALPGMYERGWGRVVNISSVHGLRASPYKSAYVVAKHGLEGLSKVIALEGGPRGVTSNCVNPAYVRTPLVERQIADQAKVHGIAPDEVIERVMLTEPAIKRLIEPPEVAELVAYLCGPHASFVNGASLVMDGGWSAR